MIVSSPPRSHSKTVAISCVNCAGNNNVCGDAMMTVARDSSKVHQLHNQRFSTVMALKRTCTVCAKRIYFSSLKCKLCNCITHRRCLSRIIDGEQSPTVEHRLTAGDERCEDGGKMLNCTTMSSPNCRRQHHQRRFYDRLVHWMNRHIRSADAAKMFDRTRDERPEDHTRPPTFLCQPNGVSVHSTAFLDANNVIVQTKTTVVEGARHPMTTVGQFGCPPTGSNKTRTYSVQSNSSDRESLCATWPPIGRKVYNSKEDNLEGSESGFEDYDPEDDPAFESNSIAPTHIKETMGEWSIPFEDLKIGRKVRTGRRHDIYRGRWHGEVMIHIFHINSDSETTQFWKEVSSMTMIRHENLALFMGVCIDMPQLAIVTSVRKARSLYEHIHVKKDHCPLPTKVHIARQVAQGMSYLHAKGITHRKLNSKNILLENKVKVCLLDQGMAQQELDREEYGCIPNGHLTYVSPEIMRSLTVQPPKLVSTLSYSEPSDVYAFGTVLYELFGERWPFQGQSSQSIIWQVGSGQVQTLDAVQCSSGLKNLISECWSYEPTCRPAFNHILRMVQENVVLHRRHSSSEPENLNRLGFHPVIRK